MYYRVSNGGTMLPSGWYAIGIGAINPVMTTGTFVKGQQYNYNFNHGEILTAIFSLDGITTFNISGTYPNPYRLVAIKSDGTIANVSNGSNVSDYDILFIALDNHTGSAKSASFTLS